MILAQFNQRGSSSYFPTNPSTNLIIRVPPNTKFEVNDIESAWTYDAPFDFIFMRYMSAAIENWPKLISNIYEYTTPGGWVEFQDFDAGYRSDDGSLKPDNIILKWASMLTDAAEKAGRTASPGSHLEGWAREAGFENVNHKIYKLPIGPWPKDKHLVRYSNALIANISLTSNRKKSA